MKNSNHPLIKALQSKTNKPFSGPMNAPMEGPRHFEIGHHELPNLAGQKVGTPITVSLKGHIHSQHHDGKAVMHVDSVKPDSSDMENKQNPDSDAPERGVR